MRTLTTPTTCQECGGANDSQTGGELCNKCLHWKVGSRMNILDLRPLKDGYSFEVSYYIGSTYQSEHTPKPETKTAILTAFDAEYLLKAMKGDPRVPFRYRGHAYDHEKCGGKLTLYVVQEAWGNRTRCVNCNHEDWQSIGD